LIFFPEACDSVKNWRNFFTSPDNRFLDYRNIYMLYPRNFGTSDRHPSFDMQEMSDDVLRFMYENKISTATFGGHGLGG
jgi:pimeloyl-ACP methyl ester carboxylesterase